MHVCLLCVYAADAVYASRQRVSYCSAEACLSAATNPELTRTATLLAAIHCIGSYSTITVTLRCIFILITTRETLLA
jgi:hypothetical protein